MNIDQLFDVVIIGAGLAGLTCARQLQQQGYKVIILEKSRGVGGRLATRRIEQISVDHGLSYFFEQGNQTQQLIQQLTEKEIMDSLTPNIYQFDAVLESPTIQSKKYYYVPQGMTAIAKFLAESLTIWRQYRVINLTTTQDKLWHLTCETPPNLPNIIHTKSLVSTIPAPQLHLLLDSSHLTKIPPSFLETLTQVTYDPCLTVMAGYEHFNPSELIWDQVRILSHPNLAWVGRENVKRETPNSSVFVFHSTPNYATQFLESTDLKPIGKQLLEQAAELLSPTLKHPAWYQVHRWRYAIPRQSLPLSCLTTTHPLPLVACGDWCGSHIKPDSPSHLEKALLSGLAAADKIKDLVCLSK